MKNYIFIAILSVILAISYYVLENIKKEMMDSKVVEKAEKQMIAFDVTAKYFNENYELSYLLKSPEITHYNLDQGSDFKSPFVTVFDQEQQEAWIGNSDQSHLTADNEMLYLEGHVKIVKDPSLSSKVTLTTDKAVYNNQTKVISGEDAIQIQDQSMKQVSTGFRFNIETNQVEFMNQVKGSYLQGN